MNEAFSGLGIQKRQTNLPPDNDDKYYNVTIDKHVTMQSDRSKVHHVLMPQRAGSIILHQLCVTQFYH